MANHFRRPRSGPVLSGEAVARQGKILKLAIDALGAGAAMAFLNAADEDLGGRPLDLAIASDEGFARIAATLVDRPHTPAASTAGAEG